MPNVPFDPRARILRLVASPLLATTSIAALLLAAPAKAGQTITNQTVATVTNPAGNATTSIVITGASVTGAVANAGTISPGKVVNGTTAGLFVSNGTTVALFVNNSTIGGGIVNSGTITTMGSTMGAQSAAGILVIGGAISGGITNTGTIDTSATLPGHAAKPMLSALGLGLVTGGVFTGAIANSGTILSQGTAPLSFTGGGNFSARVVAVGETIVANGGLNSPTGGQISSTITNTAMIGATLAVTSTFSVSGRGRADPALNVTGLSVDAGGGTATAVGATAAGGSVSGGITNAGTITASLSHTATLTDTGGNALSLAQSNASAHGLVASALGRFATASIAVVGGGSTLALNPAALAASAQDLTQDARLGLDAPRVLTQAVQDRLVASGGALGEGEAGGAGQKGVAGFSFGNANIWARGADQFGSATASGTGVGYDINRAAPLIAGVDWRLDNGIVAGVAATYVATSAKFKDGSSTNVSSYQGGAYAGWAGGPWYALGSAVVSFNEFGTSRLLTPFGLPGDATSSPSGQSYQGHAEAGYHWGVPAAGVNVSVTPYAALDYVNAHLSGFSETGGFGALSVNAADANSFQTTLGLRLTSRIAMGTYGALIPELRLGWNHEFLDASQKITASLVGVAGSAFSATGIVFGRDAALVGGGFSMELSPDAKVFVDYDGRLGSRLQEHSVSGGLKVRF